jgi:cytoskeletal protein RodZ
MALSQDEQRMLAEIERRLAADDPGLASCLTTFRRPSPATVLRSPRARIIGSVFTVLLVAMVSLMVYAMIPFRAHIPRTNPSAPAGVTAGTTSISAATRTQPDRTQQSSAGTKSTAGQPAADHSATSTPTGKSPQAKGKQTPIAMAPGGNP